MNLSKEQVEKFRKLFKEEYGKEYTYKETYEATSNLLGFFGLLWRIDRRIKNEKQKDEPKI